MASSFHKSIDRIAIGINNDEDKDVDLEKTDRSLSIKQKYEEDDEQVQRCNFIRRFLRAISIGQYDMKLYTSKGNHTYSSSLGGIMTIIVTLIVVSYAAYILINITNRNTYILDQKTAEIRTSDYT